LFRFFFRNTGSLSPCSTSRGASHCEFR
jgi:hypothetical protein